MGATDKRHRDGGAPPSTGFRPSGNMVRIIPAGLACRPKRQTRPARHGPAVHKPVPAAHVQVCRAPGAQGVNPHHGRVLQGGGVRVGFAVEAPISMRRAVSPAKHPKSFAKWLSVPAWSASPGYAWTSLHGCPSCSSVASTRWPRACSSPLAGNNGRPSADPPRACDGPWWCGTIRPPRPCTRPWPI